MTKYMFSDHEFSYFLYGDHDAVAFAYKNYFPRFWNTVHWVEKSSFLEFCDNAVRISEAEFLKNAAAQNADLSELERIKRQPDAR